MKKTWIIMIVCIMLVGATAYGQMIPRTDVVWARTTTSAITVDGQLNEAAWASAEWITIVYGIDNGMPGSGWFKENGLDVPLDSTKATVKFLVKADSLYIGVTVLDKSVGGGTFIGRNRLTARSAVGSSFTPGSRKAGRTHSPISRGECRSLAVPGAARRIRPVPIR